MKRGLLLLMLAWAGPRAACADAGVLVPAGHTQPDAKIFSLDEMTIEIRVDNGDARVAIRQIFGSHTAAVTEGSYSFALPSRAAVSDFAVWDDLTRIPGVILERRRAEEIYEALKQQAIDPGLLQQGEGDSGEARRSSAFTAKIVPIPGYGTKRIEIEYHERIPVENLRSSLEIPLRPDAYQALSAGSLRITLDLSSAEAIQDFQAVAKTYPLRIEERGPNRVRAVFEGRNVPLTEDFAIEWSLDPAAAGKMSVIAQRDPSLSATGFFQASTLVANRSAAEGPRSVVALFDTSLSMQWEKLERSYRALEGLLHALRPADRFNLLLFNSEVTAFAPAPQPATPEQVEKALAFVKATSLRGGTDLETALAKGLEQAAQGGGAPYLVLIGDGGATRGTIRNARLAAKYSDAWKRLPPDRRPRTYVFGVGDDANLPLLGLLAANDGISEWVRSTEPIDFKLAAFLSKLGKRPESGLDLSATPAANFTMVYPLEERFFPGSLASWVGQYRKPGPATFAAGGASAAVTLPVQQRGPSATAAHVGQGAGGRAAREDRTRRRGSREHRRNHTALARIQVRHALHVVPGGAAVALAAARDPAGRPGDPRQDRPFDYQRGGAVSVRAHQAAALPQRRRHLGDALSRAGGLGRRHLPGPHGAARSRGPGLPRVEDVRDREPSAGGEDPAGEAAVPGRGEDRGAGERVRKRPHHRGAALRRRAGGPALEPAGGREHGRPDRAGTGSGAVSADGDRGRCGAQHRYPGGVH